MSDNATREIFITGLKNAHAMETQALSIMKPQVKRIENYPDVAARLEQHITETEGQIARIEEILSSLDEDHSKLKDMAAAYKSLITIAETGGYNAGANSLKLNLAEEKSMAEWLDQNLPAVTTRFLSLREAGDKAKV